VKTFCGKVMLLFSNGKVRFYEGENLHRLEYNMAYLNSMFHFIPRLKGRVSLRWAAVMEWFATSCLTKIRSESWDRCSGHRGVSFQRSKSPTSRWTELAFSLTTEPLTSAIPSRPLNTAKIQRRLQEMRRVLRKRVWLCSGRPLFYSLLVTYVGLFEISRGST